MTEDVLKKYDGVDLFDAYYDKFGEGLCFPITGFAHGNERDFVAAIISALEHNKPLDLDYWYGDPPKGIIL